jgi:UDP-N-acetylglucosamine 1-carboxyvinyltransferase
VAALLRAVTTGRPLRLGQPNLSPEVLCVLDALYAVGWEARASERLLALSPPPSSQGDTVAWEVPGDKIEAGTLACAVAATGGSARIQGVRGKDVSPLVATLQLLGIPSSTEANALCIRAQDARPTDHPLRAIASLSPGGLDADFEPPLMALSLGLPGTHLFADAINPGRHGNLLPQLARLGADIEEISPTECRLTGPQRLTGAGVEATDIRTGSALMVAGLTARGVTTLGGLDQLRRGHADLPGKLRTLGADICEVTP